MGLITPLRSSSASGSDRPWKTDLLLGWNMDSASYSGAASLQPTAAFIYLAKIMVPESITITNILLNVAQAGTSYTNTQVGLYNSSGTYLAASAVLASGGTNTFGSTGNKTIALDAPQTVVGSPTTFVWVGLHMGTNGATVVMFPAILTSVLNIGTAAATTRWGLYTGHVTNNLATIGNLTPASIAATTNPTWFGIS